MGRPTNMPEPLKTMAEQAGGVEPLRVLMNEVPASTLRRWGRALSEKKPLPRAAMQAIEKAQEALKEAQTKEKR